MQFNRNTLQKCNIIPGEKERICKYFYPSYRVSKYTQLDICSKINLVNIDIYAFPSEKIVHARKLRISNSRGRRGHNHRTAVESRDLPESHNFAIRNNAHHS